MLSHVTEIEYDNLYCLIPIKREAVPMARKAVRRTKAKTVYQLQIALQNIQPPIWRTIQIPDGTLDDLHVWIQTAMGWENSHLHQFDIDGQRYANSEFMDEDFEEVEFEDTLETRLSDILDGRREGFRFIYLYDVGDHWEHEVRYEGHQPGEPGVAYPRCTAGQRACPLEDCGGARGYGHLLEVLADPRHKEYAEMNEWAGDFDAERFSPDEATLSMQAGLPEWDEDDDFF
jgi:hypothetical protein